MSFTDWTGLTSLALVWVLLALRLPVFVRLSRYQRIVYVAAAYFLALLPFFGLSPAAWLRGMLGDLSLTSVMLLSISVYRSVKINPGQSIAETGGWNPRDRFALMAFLSLIALLLYPFALGIGNVDPYRSGFAGVAFIVMLALLALWALRRSLTLLPLALALAVLGWTVGWYESANLWDYLIDAPLAICALVVILQSLLRNFGRGKRA